MPVRPPNVPSITSYHHHYQYHLLQLNFFSPFWPLQGMPRDCSVQYPLNLFGCNSAVLIVNYGSLRPFDHWNCALSKVLIAPLLCAAHCTSVITMTIIMMIWWVSKGIVVARMPQEVSLLTSPNWALFSAHCQCQCQPHWEAMRRPSFCAVSVCVPLLCHFTSECSFVWCIWQTKDCFIFASFS